MRPPVNDAWVKPFGADIKGKMTLGGKPPDTLPEARRKPKKISVLKKRPATANKERKRDIPV